MTAPSSPPPRSPGRDAGAAQVRAIVLWALSLVVTLGLAGLLAWAGVLLAIFGLSGVALAVAALMTAIGMTVWRRGMLPMAVLAAALVLPAAAVALGETRFERSAGLLTVRPDQVEDLDPTTTYRRGSGPVFIDLRKLRPAAGITMRVKARADNGPVIVALPHDQCLQTRIRYRVNRSFGDLTEFARSTLSLAGADNGSPGGVLWSSMGTSSRTIRDEEGLYDGFDTEEQRSLDGLNAYGRSPRRGVVPIGDGRLEWTRAATEPNAAKLELDLTASDQVIVRDYPDWAAPLSTGLSDGSTGYGSQQVSSVAWPQGVQAPLSPGNKTSRFDASIRTPENRARWVKWEREMLAWGKEQARRFAGPCATDRELARRAVSFWTQPAAVRQRDGSVDRLVGGPTTRTSPITQPVFTRNTVDMYAEVNGLGQATVTGYDRRGRGGFTNEGLNR